MKVYTGLMSPTNATATTSAAGYPATNMLTSQILKPWRSTNTGSHTITIDFGATVSIAAFCVDDLNWSAARNILYSTDNISYFTAATVTAMSDAQGRYKMSAEVNVSARYIQFSVLAATPTTDGAAFYRVGSVQAYSNIYTPPRDPLFGGSSLDLATPQSRLDLDNGIVVRDTTGPSFQLLNLDFSGAATDDHEQIQQYCRAGICWINLAIPQAPWQQWPMRHHDPKITRKLAGYNRELVSMTLKEEV